MFRGKIFLTNISVAELVWSSQDSELRPYLVIFLDGLERKRVRCEEAAQDQLATTSPDWRSLFIQIPDVLVDHKNLQFTIFHNSDAVPHLSVAHLELEIAHLKECLDKGTTNETNFTENFPEGGSISFTLSMEEEKIFKMPSEHILHRGNKVERCFPIKGHKFRKNYFNEPTFCKTCNKMIWGITEVQQNGLKCVNCKMAVHKRCYEGCLVECRMAQTKTTTETTSGGSRVSLKNSHDFKETRINLIPKICQVHMQYIWHGNCLKCKNCNAYVHKECRDLIGKDCGVDVAELSRRLERYNHERAQRDAEKEANQKLEEARGIFEETKRKKTVMVKGKKKNQPSLNDFELLQVLGCGAFGKVVLVVHKETKKPYAMKALKKNNILEDDEMEITMTERNVLAMGEQCRFITSLYCSFQSTDRLFFVMEYLNGGDLFFHILKERKFSEERSRFYCAQISLAFLFLHSRRIVYRDLKLDNVMLTQEGDVKLTDFGMCKEKISPRNQARTFCGTPHYIAPEVIREQPYSFPVDWWSLGVLTYEMIMGHPPFDDRRGDFDEIYKKIIGSEPKFRGTISHQAKDFISALLVKNPQNRLVGEDVQSHPFFGPLDWEALSAGELTPPYVPDSGDPLDTTNFEEQFTSLDTNFSIIQMDKNLKELCETSFPDFSFYDENTSP